MPLAKRIVLHPFLFALSPVVFLYANNLDRVPLPQTFRLILILLLAVTLFILLMRLLTRSWQRAGLITSLAAILFSSYSHIYFALNGKSSLVQADLLAAIWASLMIVGGWFLWRILAQVHLQAVQRIANIFATFLFLIPFVTLTARGVQLALFRPAGTLAETQPAAPSGTPGSRPNIYYIILDEYGRSDMLRQMLSCDNSAFIDALRERGFYIADESYSNYGITLISLASSLNFRYLNDSVSPLPEDTPSNTRFIIDSIRNSNIRTRLERAGYHFITFATGYFSSEIKDSDHYIEPTNYINDFELLYINSTALALLSDEVNGARARTLIHYNFHELGRLPQSGMEQPMFVFAHIQSNHAPYVFGPDGEPVKPWGFSAAPGQSAGAKTYVQAYCDQMVYINRLVLQTIDQILETSEPKPVIILQGDHGTQSHHNWFSVEDSCVKERHAILNAYYFPDGDYQDLYPSITPVNTFRVVLNKYFNAGLPLEPDRMYFSEWNHSYDFIEVTGKMVDCTP